MVMYRLLFWPSIWYKMLPQSVDIASMLQSLQIPRTTTDEINDINTSKFILLSTYHLLLLLSYTSSVLLHPLVFTTFFLDISPFETLWVLERNLGILPM